MTQDETDDSEIIPFMEMEIAHKLHVNLSQYSSEVIDFTITSIEAKVINYGIYYQSEAELQTDDDAKQELLDLINGKYI